MTNASAPPSATGHHPLRPEAVPGSGYTYVPASPHRWASAIGGRWKSRLAGQQSRQAHRPPNPAPTSTHVEQESSQPLVILYDKECGSRSPGGIWRWSSRAAMAPIPFGEIFPAPPGIGGRTPAGIRGGRRSTS